MDAHPTSPDELGKALRQLGYHATRQLVVAIHLAIRLQRPLLLEGEPGVGKTELSKVLAKLLGRQLVRLQCYDGLDLREALYEWNYASQLLHMRAAQGTVSAERLEQEVYQARYLIARPLLQALQAPAPGAVLLVDEVDRADEPFEAFLLEYLGEQQITIPEIGTLNAVVPPITILTSNRTRELNDAIKRRCLYQWLDYPSRDQELAIIRDRVPQAGASLTMHIADFVQSLRSNPHSFQRQPGIAESVDWARALLLMDAVDLTAQTVQETAGVLFKQREDVVMFLDQLDRYLPTVAS